ncbi:hypothetical protein Ddc_12143 [Ditylenchus destructor]|nr:hypothetical protein Ddc_12143 [Ditylenchus destructor]
MSTYDSADDSSSEESKESSYSSDEWYKCDKLQRSLNIHLFIHTPEPIRNFERFQWCLFYTYGWQSYVGGDEECHEKLQFGWEKAFDLVSGFLQHETGCNIKTFLSLKHPFGHDSGDDDTGCLQYAKDRKSRIHIHKKFLNYGTPFGDINGLSTIDVTVNEDLNFKAVIRSHHGRYLINLTEKRVPIFKRQMRLRRSLLGKTTSLLYFTQDCHLVRGTFRKWRDERRECRIKTGSGFKKKSIPPAYAKCKNSARHKKSVIRKKRLPHKTKLPKTINKMPILKHSVKSIQKEVVQNPAKLLQENDNEEKQKPAPIGDTLGPVH